LLSLALVAVAITPTLSSVFTGTVTSDAVYPGPALSIMVGGVATSSSVPQDVKNGNDAMIRIANRKLNLFIFLNFG
jgi:hypothetical protein